MTPSGSSSVSSCSSPFIQGAPPRRRALLYGLSTRAISLFLEPLLQGADSGAFSLSDHLEIVGVIEPDTVRIRAVEEKYGCEFRRFTPEEWEDALRLTEPDLLLVAVPDYLHADCIIRGLEAGLDIITEKPMVISIEEAARVVAKERESAGTVRVAFNYRYNPLHARLKAFFDEGRLGRIVQVDLHYTLDTLHGASYFYRWNRERRFSGSLAVHKCCHSFDLVRWMIGQEPMEITALGGLDYYGPKSPHRPGGLLGNDTCPYFQRWFACEEALPVDDHPIYHLQGDKGFPFAYQYPERLSLYDVAIDVEDHYSALIRFDKGAHMTFSVNFSAPWEGYRMTVNGTEGRLEVDCLMAPQRCPLPAESQATFYPLFSGKPEKLEWPKLEGGHGGADPRMLREIFAHDATEELPNARDGGMAVAMGEGVWRSAVDGRTIRLAEMKGFNELLHSKPAASPKVIRKQSQRAGFSLIEVVGALLIITVILLLAIPVVKNTRQQMRTTVCLSQLRNLWSSAMLFAGERNGRLCSLNIEKSCRDAKSPGFREYLGYTANLFTKTTYTCPQTQAGEFPAGGNMFRSYSVSRLIVSNWAPVDSGATVVAGAVEYISRVELPSQTLYLVDGIPNPGNATASRTGVNYLSNVSATSAASLVELHRGKLNAIYLDGRGVTLNRSELERPKNDILWGPSVSQ